MIKLTRKLCPDPVHLRTDYKYPINKQALKDSSHGKCMYCESSIDHIDHGDVEHIKPKSIYPQYKFDWDNLGYSCSICNRKYKGEKDDTNLINPYIDNPADYLIALGGIFVAIKGNIRGQVTIDIVQLNRKELLSKRAETLKSFGDLISRYHNAQSNAQKEAIEVTIKDEISETKEFSACKKTFWEASK